MYMKLSKSKINLYLECPRKFYYKEILKLEEPITPQIERGKNIHEFCEKFWKEEKWKFFLEENVNLDEIVDEGIRNFILIEKERMKKYKKNFVPILVESKIETEEYSAIIDRLDKDDYDNYEIIEIKTGKFHRKYISELYFYKFLLENFTIYKNIKKGKIFLLDENKVIEVIFDKNKLNSILEVVDFVKKRINENFYPPNFTYLCEYCYFKNRCENDNKDEQLIF